jgi:hypothetical protein
MAASNDPLALNYDYSRLSLSDLLNARDLYHFHLLNRPNVVGTAIGLYLIRKDEQWPSKPGEGRSPPNKKTYPRNFANSEVRDYSWPCVLVLVKKWEPSEAFGPHGAYEPAQIIPKTLYLADGRAVPVCVVEVHPAQATDDEEPLNTEVPPAYKFGGGLPISVRVQGAEYHATAGCLVTDGHLTYALTAKHVCGEAGTKVTSRLRGGEVTVGVSSEKQLTHKPFSKVYPDFPARRSYVSLDVGLIRIDEVDAWTSNTYGLPPLGQLADVHEHNLTFRLIDHKVMGYGAASGLLRGTIKALFYRYRSVGGYDYVGDFLISPDAGPSTRHGDSGMVWNLDLTDDSLENPVPVSQRDLRPLAVEWGGQVFVEDGRRSAFAVATSLSNVCKLLDVELVSDRSRGVSGYWGRTGHYSIAAFALSLVENAALKAFLQANLTLLSFDLADIEKKDFDKSVGVLSAADKFVPLADVPDEIWKKLPKARGGREGGRDHSGGASQSNGPEHPNHYADIDAPFGPDHKSWRQKCLDDHDNVSVQAWQDFYKTIAQAAEDAGNAKLATQYRSKLKQGLLPFRVWQFFDAMVEFADQKDVVGFLAAAGTCAHYVGDASQPLHGSVLADGDPSRTVERFHPNTGETETVKFGEGVHSTYETAMLAFKAHDLFQSIRGKLPQSHGLHLCATGKASAIATLKLMDKVAGIASPESILQSFENAGAGKSQATLNAMWADLGDQTAHVMLEGARALAMLWESAWTKGNGGAIPAEKLKKLKPSEVRKRYIKDSFVPSLTLDLIDAVLKK